MNKSRGFTLIEILVVIAIIGILIVATHSKLSVSVNNSNIDYVEKDLKMISYDIEKFILDYGEIYIEDIENKSEAEIDEESRSIISMINAYTECKFDTENIKVDDRGFIQGYTIDKKDTWGEPYRIIIDTDGDRIYLISYGPDNKGSLNKYYTGEFEDDIVMIMEINK